MNEHSKNTYEIQLPGSNRTTTEIGIRSNSRSPLTYQLNQPDFLGEMTETVWLLWHNENKTATYDNPCGGAMDKDWIQSPYPGPVKVKNLLYPYDEQDLVKSELYFNENGQEPTRGCLPKITLEPFGFRAYVPIDIWLPGPPAMTKFSPGHDHRLLTVPGAQNETTFDITFEYDQEMDCGSIDNNLTLNFTGIPGATAPTFRGNGVCSNNVDQTVSDDLSAVAPSAWSYTRTIQNAGDGLYEFMVGRNAATYPAARTTGVSAQVILVLVFPLAR